MYHSRQDELRIHLHRKTLDTFNLQRCPLRQRKSCSGEESGHKSKKLSEQDLPYQTRQGRHFHWDVSTTKWRQFLCVKDDQVNSMDVFADRESETEHWKSLWGKRTPNGQPKHLKK